MTARIETPARRAAPSDHVSIPGAKKQQTALTAEQLRQLATMDPSVNVLDAGRLKSLRKLTRVPSQLAIIDRLMARPKATVPKPAKRWWVDHSPDASGHIPFADDDTFAGLKGPGATPGGNPRGPKPPAKTPSPLAAADLQWLDRLPVDPAQMSQSDVKALVRLAGEVKSMGPMGNSRPSRDELLVRTYLDPVIAHLERQARIEELRSEIEALPKGPDPRQVPPLPTLEADPVVRELVNLAEAEAKAKLDGAAAAGQDLDGVKVDRRTFAEEIAPKVAADRKAFVDSIAERRSAAVAELATLEAP